MVKVLVERFRVLVDDSKATFKETNLREWKVVVQEILRFLKVDTAYKNTRPLRYCTILDSYPASLPYVARFHAKKVLKLRDTLLVIYHRNECLEWEPSGSFFQMQTTETSNNGGLNDQSGTSGLIDINLAMNMTDPTLPPNPRKAILHRPSATHLISVLCIRKQEEPIDLFMVDIMHMRHKFDIDTRLKVTLFAYVPRLDMVLLCHLWKLNPPNFHRFDGSSELVAELVTENCFKAAYAIKDGTDEDGWILEMEMILISHSVRGRR